MMTLLAATLHAQESPFGTHFLLAFPDTAIAHIGPFSPYTGTDVRLTIFALDTAQVRIACRGFARTVTVLPEASTTISLLDSDLARPFIDLADTALNDAIDVTSDAPISILCYFYSMHGSEAFVPIPVDQWGTDYFAMSLRNALIFHAGNRGDLEENIYPDYAPAEILIIADDDETDITINATTPTRKFTDTTFRMNRGDVYLIESHDPWATTDTLSRDLSGTRITSTKPVGVISGNTRSSGGFGGTYYTLPTGNSLANSLIEWLRPSSSGGNTFVYRPNFTRSNERTQEIVRIYATSPGKTSVAASNGFPIRTMQEGECIQYGYCADPALAVPAGAFSTPFALRTDKPAAAMVVTASLSERGGLLADSSLSYVTWSPAMSLLPSREEWITFGRFHAPSVPTWIEHVATIVADSGARVWIDTTEVEFDLAPVEGTPFRHAIVSLAGGDHTIRSAGGRFGAIASGTLRGMEEFRPLGARKDGDAWLLHPSHYVQMISTAYAYPIYGVNESTAPVDSIDIDVVENCDSVVVLVRRIGQPWLMGPMRLEILPDSVNAGIGIQSDLQGGVPIGYRLRFAPIDPNRLALATLRITGMSGRTWDVPLVRPSPSVVVRPEPLSLFDIPVGVEKTLDITLTNQRSFVVTVLGARLLGGVPQFSLRGTTSLPQPLLPAGSTTLVVAFTGTKKNATYDDSLVVETTCGTFVLPVHGRTGPDPIPTITGYDWRERLIRSTNDTLSFIGNSGSRGFLISSVSIAGDLAGAFSLVPPAAPVVDSVLPPSVMLAGIRFTPPHQGSFTAAIVLATDDRDTVVARLHGTGILPRVIVSGTAIDTFCVDSLRTSTVDVINPSEVDVRFSTISLMSSPEVVASLDTIPPFLPLTVPARGRAAIPIVLAPAATGPYSVSARLAGDVTIDTTIATGLVTTCLAPDLDVTDHDFDSLFITLKRQGSVWVRNRGGGTVMVTRMRLAEDTSSSFAILWPTPPFIIPDKGMVEVRCEFSPGTIGLKTAAIDYDTRLGPLRSQLSGVGKKLLIPAMIRRDYHAEPGQEVTLHVELMGRLDTLPVGSVELAVAYDPLLLDYLALDVPRAADSNWIWFGDRDTDSIRCHIAFNGRPPTADTLLSMRHLVRLSTLDSSELPFRAIVDLPYVEIVPMPGLFRRDPFCGLEERLFEFSTTSFRLDQNRPNPFTRSTAISFELPFDNPTTLAVYNTLGDRVVLLYDGILAAGVYTATTPDGVLPSGVYYYRLKSGPFAATRRMIAE